MQDGQKDGALDQELETPPPEKLLDNGPAAGLVYEREPVSPIAA